jgi:hypothetical protein
MNKEHPIFTFAPLLHVRDFLVRLFSLLPSACKEETGQSVR